MRLCFGTFARVLNCCRKNITQGAFIARIVNTIDSDSRYSKEHSLGEDSAINKLLSCKIDFVLSKKGATKIPERDIVVNNFETEVIPYVDEDKKAKIILTLLDIIRTDSYIDSEKQKTFKKYFNMDKQNLLQKSEIVFSEFLVKILLYTTCGGVNNIDGQTHVKIITTDYIDSIAKSYKGDFLWNTSNQTLTLSFLKMFKIFNKAIVDYKIDDFINSDPTDFMKCEYIDSCEDFLEFTKNNIEIPFVENANSWTLQKIQQFKQVLNNYTNYLGLKMRQIAERPDIFVPIYRDENPKWALEFEREIINYHSELISIYEEISNHMPFTSKPTSEHSE